jgi:EmrB/QacA subfamily drug resistance transporter
VGRRAGLSCTQNASRNVLRVEKRHRVLLGVLTFAGISYALQQTMVLPALPALQHDLHTTTAWATWLFTAFLLTASVATPLLGKLGDQYGKERFLVVTLAVFLVGSIAAAAAPDIWTLIAARAVQGVSGAVFPLSFSIIRDEFPRERVGVAVGIVSSVFAVGGGLGLVLSGLIVDHLSWRYLFVVGAVGIAIALVLVQLFVPESPIKTPSRIDVPGALLLSAGLVALLLALTEGSSWGWSSARVLGLFVASFLALAAWVVVELEVAEPMVDVKMLAERTVLLTNLNALVIGFALFGAFVLVPNFVQTPVGLSHSVAAAVHYGFHASSTKTGLYLLPSSLAGIFSGTVAGVLGNRYGSKWPLALGSALGAGGIASLALWHDRPWQIVIGMLVVGSGFPFSFAAMAKLIVDAVKPSETGVATGVNNVMRTVGGVIGGQVSAAILTTKTIGKTHVPAESAFATAFWISAAAALVALFVALLVTPRRSRARLAFARAVEEPN